MALDSTSMLMIFGPHDSMLMIFGPHDSLCFVGLDLYCEA